jgi:DNA polymerase
MGQGNVDAEVVFVGEAPGEEEDKSGLAFVGRSGQLLTKMIEALKLSRDLVWIGNINKCRPPGNRTPTPEEMATCSPFLVEQLKVIKPKVICALGKTAAVGLGLIRPTDSLGKARGKTHHWNEIPTILTYHPSYLLRSPGEKKKAWEDLQLLVPYVTRRVNESSS